MTLRDRSDYDAHLGSAQHSYTGRVLDAFLSEQERAKALVPQWHIHRAWWRYQGEETPPFVAYTRWQTDRLTLAALYGNDTHQGRMSLICEAMETIAKTAGLSLRYESISNPHLVRYLRRRGCEVVPGTELMPDMTWHPVDAPARA